MDYRIREDIETACQLLDISYRDLAMEIGVDEKTVYRAVKGQTLLSYPKMEAFYEFLFRNRIQINAIKEMSYRENMPSANKLLFHGSKAGIEGDVDIAKSSANNDFGHGFYTGESLSQSLAFVEAYESSSVYLFEFDPRGLSHKRFRVDDEWMLAIAYFRGRLSSYSSSPMIRKIVSDVDSADYLIAPVADNRMFQIIDSFIAGELTDEQCRHCLSATNLGNQYVLKSDRAANQLRMLERLYICDLDRKSSRKKKSEDAHLSENKVKLAKKTYRGKGKYIGDLL